MYKPKNESDDDLDEGEEYNKYKASLKQDFKQICKYYAHIKIYKLSSITYG